MLAVVRLVVDSGLFSEQFGGLFVVEQLPIGLVAIGGECRHGVGPGQQFHIPLIQGGQAAKFAGGAIAGVWPVLVDTFSTTNGQALDNSQAQAQVAFFAFQGVVPLAGIHIRRQHGDIVPPGVLHQL